MSQVVQILHAHYLCNRLRFCQLLRSDIAQTEMADQPLMLEFSKRSQGFFKAPLRWPHHFSDPKVDLIRHMRTVIVAGINMIHAGRNRLPEDANRSVNITWRSPDLRTG